MMLDNQIRLEDVDADYKAFVDKFKSKKTTDDCYTPPAIYEAILDWVRKEYGLRSSDPVVRPFWPGADYLRQDYPQNCVVVDNPPFSILSEIVRTFQAAGVRFFLFAPYLTNFSTDCAGVCHIITDCKITYANGAQVNTSFLTNLDDSLARTAPALVDAIREAEQASKPPALPVYKYPPNVITATRLGYLARYGVPVKVYPAEAAFVRDLDAQKPHKKTIFGAGYLISDAAAGRLAEAEAEAEAARKRERGEVDGIEWELSRRERDIIERLA